MPKTTAAERIQILIDNIKTNVFEMPEEDGFDRLRRETEISNRNSFIVDCFDEYRCGDENEK